MMNYEEFKETIVKKIADYLPPAFDGCHIEIRKVTKNNDLILDALMIHPQNDTLCPGIYLEEYYEAYKSGKCLADLLTEIARTRVEYDIPKEVDVSYIKRFDKIKNKIEFRIINRDKNKKRLSEIPHRNVADLSLYYCIPIEEFRDSAEAVLTITSALLEFYGIEESDLYEIALNNMRVKTPAVFEEMHKVMRRYMRQMSIKEDFVFNEVGEGFMYRLTIKGEKYGASILADKEFMKSLSLKLEDDYYIIPSSVHELLIIPAANMIDIAETKKTIHEVNRVHVVKEERLSDNLYYYSRSFGWIITV